MIADFDSSANGLWTLYGKEAKSHDEAQIQTLKEDMDGVLIFVRLCIFMPRIMLIIGSIGWSIFCCPYRIHNRQQAELESQSCRRDGVLPPTKCCHPRSDFSSNLLHCAAGPHPFYPPAPIPCFRTVDIRHPGECLMVHGPHFQPFCSTPCNPRPAMGSRLHARLQAI